MMLETQAKDRIVPSKIKYIKDSDILFIHLSPFLYYYGDEVSNGFYIIRRDNDDSVLGFQIMDYSTHSPDAVREFLSSAGYETEYLPKV
jgi:hypothetical protein